jgi:hypothetical protein
MGPPCSLLLPYPSRSKPYSTDLGRASEPHPTSIKNIISTCVWCVRVGGCAEETAFYSFLSLPCCFAVLSVSCRCSILILGRRSLLLGSSSIPRIDCKRSINKFFSRCLSLNNFGFYKTSQYRRNSIRIQSAAGSGRDIEYTSVNS